MAACSDPYHELELYLEKAQEEIGKAFEELLQHEAASVKNSWNDAETVLPPPPGFRSSPGHTLCCSNIAKKTNPLTHSVSSNTMNRVCYDGTLLDLQNPPYGRHKDGDSLYLLQKSLSCSAAFSECNMKQMTNGHREFITNSSSCKLKPKPFRSALSFPEGAMDSILNKTALCKDTTYSCRNNGKLTPVNIIEDCLQRNIELYQYKSESLSAGSYQLRRLRQRSHSETSPPKNIDFVSDDHFYTFPRPPSGDVNLLSIWADKLVLEIDKTMPLELDDSVGSYSPLSDYSLSPVKNDDDHLTNMAQCIDDKKINFRNHNNDLENISLSQNILYKPNVMSNHFKSMSPSPDSGIGPILNEPTENEIVADTNKQYENHNFSRKAKLPEESQVNITNSITLPPPGFEDTTPDKKVLKLFPYSREPRSNNVTRMSVNMKDAETQVRQQTLKVATCVTVQTDKMAEEENASKEIHRHARVIPSMSVDLEDCATVTTVCAVSDAPWNGAVFKSVEDYLKNHSQVPHSASSIPSDSYLSISDATTDEVFEDAEQRQPETIHEDALLNVSAPHFFTLPKQVNCAKDVDRYSCSLPRDAGRPPPDDENIIETPQRSASSSAVSSVSQVSMEELADFMRRVKTSTYLPPPNSDDKNANEEEFGESNRDAVTQTTPVIPLSRSSSFTWVTECDCSDWDSSNPRSESEDSWLAFSLSNTTTSDKKVPPTSSSGSTDDDGFDPPQNSDCSSLYLSACSEASDLNTSDSSIREQKASEGTVVHIVSEHLPQNPSFLSAAEKFSPDGDSKSLPSGGVLTDIAEEDSMAPDVSRSPLIGSCPGDLTTEISAMPLIPKSDNNAYQKQPIEAKVLIVNEADAKSLPIVILRPKKHSSFRKGHTVSSNVSMRPTGIDSKQGSSSRKEQEGEEETWSREEAELQALEACRWLRATGFPQYAQMYDDNSFPIDISIAQKDHISLHPDSIQSLFRRLNTLNRCSRMKFVETIPRRSTHLDDSDEEEECALSENWQFQRSSRRWSRIPSPIEVESENNKGTNDRPASPKPCCRHPGPVKKYLTPEDAYSSSHDSVFVDDQHSSPDSIRRTPRKDDQFHPLHAFQNSPGSSSGSGGTLSVGSEEVHEKDCDPQQKNLYRSGSDRIKEGAKALFRRMESLKGKRKKKDEEPNNVENSQAVSSTLDTSNGTDGSSCSSSIASSPMVDRSCRVRVPIPQNTSGCNQSRTPQLKHKKKGWNYFHRSERDTNAHSDSECPIVLISESWDDSNQNDKKVSKNYLSPQSTLKVPEVSSCHLNVRDHNLRTNVLKENKLSKNKCIHNFCDSYEEKKKCLDRASHYDNCPAPLAVFNEACVDSIERDAEQSKSPTGRSDDHIGSENNDGEIIIINSERRDSGVGASLTRGSSHHYAPWHSFPQRPTLIDFKNSSIPLVRLSAPQVLLLRKLSLLKLTTLMENQSLSSRTGWSWGVTKFIRRIRSPDHKNKLVFGVPLPVVLQRSGKALPNSIEAAFKYLRSTALDSTGLFRKSGVRSRIQRLRNLTENSPETVNYEDHQQYDVADMLKQYFRELPEALLTNKLSETFISIFQQGKLHIQSILKIGLDFLSNASISTKIQLLNILNDIPEKLHLEAVQATFLLLPDENREVLYALLAFLWDVTQHSRENQMTATNLAVCFAPSLFHLPTQRSASASPKRKTLGSPDLKELNENRAAYECLSCMISNYEELCFITEDMFLQSRLPGIEEYNPIAFGELSSLVHKKYRGWRTYIEGCIQASLKESKDKYKGWEGVCQIDNIDLASKIIDDDHALKLWKVSTEVEAPPAELLNCLLRERHVWDDSILKWKVVQTLDKQTEVYQYACSSVPPHAPCDYCIIRSWKTDLPKGACILIEASVNHPEAHMLVNGVRAIILASRYLIEPCGSGKSRITHISRVDTKGRSPEWHHRVYGHMATLNLKKLRDSFCHVRTEGPETKV